MSPQPQQITGQQLLQQLAGVCFDYRVLQTNAEALRRALPANRQILIAAMPKTGSTWLVKTLSAVTGRPYNLCSFSEDDTERLYFPTLARDCLLRQVVSKLHCPATAANLELIYAFNISPIVQVRNLYDAVVSQREHLLREAQQAEDPLASRLRHYLGLDESRQYDLVIDTWVPRVLAFFEGWQTAQQEHDWLRLHWVEYDGLNSDPIATIQRVLRFLGLPADEGQIQAALASLPGDMTRKNKAVSGRGKFLLNPLQKQRIAGLAGHYPWVDFSLLGMRQGAEKLVRVAG